MSPLWFYWVLPHFINLGKIFLDWSLTTHILNCLCNYFLRPGRWLMVLYNLYPCVFFQLVLYWWLVLFFVSVINVVNLLSKSAWCLLIINSNLELQLIFFLKPCWRVLGIFAYHILSYTSDQPLYCRNQLFLPWTNFYLEQQLSDRCWQIGYNTS